METFYYILDEKGEPVHLLHGTNSVRYEKDGSRTEIAATAIQAKNWDEAVAKILAGRQTGKTWSGMGVREVK